MSTRAIPHVVQADELARLLGDPDVRVVDVRWRLGDPSAGAAAYAKGHIPGAVFVDLDRDLASTPGAGGRHPLPTAAAFEEVMRRLGIGDETRVVAYDDQAGAIAGRLWFLLRYFGHETGAVLDGGIDAYVRTGGALETDRPTLHSPAIFTAKARPELVVDRAGVAASLARSGTLLLDARAPERFRGDSEPIDARAGHIPGAINAPYAGNLEGGKLLPATALADRFRALGADTRETVVYCGSGVTACHDALAIAVAGLPDAKIYVGSWSEWSRDPSAAIATGD